MGESIYVYSESAAPTKYFFRGMLQNDKGMTLQVGSTIWAYLYESEGIDFAIPIQFWMSIHPQQGLDAVPEDERSPNVPPAWYESVLGGGWMLRLGQIEATGRLNMYMSPNGSFAHVTEGTLRLRWNDWEYWDADNPNQVFRGFQMYYLGALELAGARDGISSDGQGMYGEIGATPRFHILESAGLGVDWLVPFAAGSGIRYFETIVNGEVKDNFVGYMRFGMAFDLEARFLPRRLGEWGMKIGADLLSAPSQAEADDSRVSDVEMIFTTGAWGRF